MKSAKKAAAMTAREEFRAHPSFTGRVNLAEVDPGETNGLSRKKALKAVEGDWSTELGILQEKLWAQKKKSMLVVLQGLDTSGKDGTVKHVMSDMNVQGVRVVAFKQPTPEEQRHDFLWRVKKHLPVAGEIVVFNRSHYEDVLVTRAKALVPIETIDKRYEMINRFEAGLVRAGTTVVKIMLHVSPEEQRQRFLDRLDDPTKQWKFSPADLKERTRWNAYMEAYEIALTKCNPDIAPWFVVPSDNKWYRNWVISRIMLQTMQGMKLAYPDPHLNVRAIRKQILSG
ncbi:MAG TPA: PPK2 family polyphosphate kinase [Candidatus Dormibacteraeota bacterium]|nr:PPK2 family polyphosphate kinase [Candidatus Dormibacteraeota bacterium]